MLKTTKILRRIIEIYSIICFLTLQIWGAFLITKAQVIENFIAPQLPAECQNAGLSDPSACQEYMNNLMAAPTQPAPPTPAPENTTQPSTSQTQLPQPSQNYTSPAAMSLSPQCQSAGLTDPLSCQTHMMKLMAPATNQPDFQPSGQPPASSPTPTEQVIPDKCIEAGFYDKMQCQDYLEGKIMPSKIQKPEELGLTLDCAKAGITNQQMCQEFMAKQAGSQGIPLNPENFKGMGPETLPPPCQEQNITDMGQCIQYLQSHGGLPEGMMGPPAGAESFMPRECKEQGITDPAECEKTMQVIRMPLDCRQQNITDPKECEKYLRAKFMPPPCREAGAIDERECERIMFARHAPADCKKAGVTNPKDCEKLMTKQLAPKVCQAKGATSKADCEKIIFETYGKPDECQGLLDVECMNGLVSGKIKSEEIEQALNAELSPHCQKLGAKSFAECEKLTLEKNVPTECKEAGAFTREACEKVMFEKFNKEAMARGEQMMPTECVEAGAKSPQDCDRVMRARYFPKECQAAGIENEQDCQILMAKKNLPSECFAAQAFTREACEKIMRDKYMNPECKAAGITDKDTCEKYMFEKYAKRVKCEGISDEECQLAIEKRHLGQIVKKQQEFAEVKDKVDDFIGKNLILGPEQNKTEGTSQNQITQTPEEKAIKKDLSEIIPLKVDKEIKLLVLPAKEESIINKDESIIQTLPAAIMFDNDQDGLPDDLELRLGTNPDQLNSDQDQFSDLEELKNGYNPLGEGKFQGELAGIDQAIIHQTSLGQPLTSGEESVEGFAITQVATVEVNTAGMEIGPEVPVFSAPAPTELMAIPPQEMPVSPQEAAPSSVEPAPAPVIENQPQARLFFIQRAWAKEESTKDEKVKLRGKGPANTVVTLYIYSDIPIIVTTKTDEQGAWNYTLKEDLTNGEHKVYVAYTDQNGNVLKKSKPYSLLIQSASAVSPQEFIQDVKKTITAQKPTTQQPSNIIWYISGGVILLLIGVTIFFLLWRQKKKV